MNAATCDRAALAALESALSDARSARDERPAFVLLADALAGLSVGGTAARREPPDLVRAAREDWLARLRSAGRSDSALRGYTVAIDGLLAYAERMGCGEALFQERTIVAHLEDYRARCAPAPATYHRRFLLLRRFMRWVAQREGLPDPFAELDAPARPREEADWLTQQEFARLLAAVGQPVRPRAGTIERDRLVLLALVTTGLRRAELVAVDWGDLDLQGPFPSVLVRRGKGGKPRRQPLARELAAALTELRAVSAPASGAPVFCGLHGRRLQAPMLALIIRRAATRAGLEKTVTAHTLRHTAATWLRQATGDVQLVAQYLGHADLSTVSRYAHVAGAELHGAAQTLGALSAQRAA